MTPAPVAVEKSIKNAAVNGKQCQQKIREIESVTLLEEILESIFDFNSEKDLMMALHKKG